MLLIPARSELKSRPLESARLVLTPVEASDAAEMWPAVEQSRKELEPWLPWVPFTVDLESETRYTEASSADWDAARACRFAIRERASKRFLGVVGLESLAHLHESAELGYWLRTDAIGQGYMTEAANTLLHWAFGPANAHRVRVAAATHNHASLRVIARLGFRFEGIARHAERCMERWLDHAVFSLIATDVRPS